MPEYIGYVAFGPNSSGDIVPRYIGIGAPGREQHCLLGRKSHNLLVESHKTKDGWCVEVKQEFNTREDAVAWEISKIAAYGRKDLSTGSLFNLTDGGDGHRGANKDYCRTVEYRATMSKAKADQNTGENNPMYGKRGEDNPKFGKKYGTKPKISAAKKDFYNSDNGAEWKKKISEKLSGANNPMYGKAPANAQPVTIDGVLYKSKTYAEKCLRANGLSRQEAITKIEGSINVRK